MDPCPICGAPGGAVPCGCPAGAPRDEPLRVRPYAPRPEERADGGREPAVADLGLFAAGREPGAEPVPYGGVPRRGGHRAPHRRRGPAIAGLAFAVTALTAAAVGLALRSSPQQERTEHARPDQRPSRLEAAPTAAGGTPGSREATPPHTTGRADPPTTGAAKTPPPARTKGSRTASSSASRTGDHRQPHGTRTPSGRGHHHGRHHGHHGVLRPGDTGPEVADLQRRLARVGLYAGAPDGRYDGGVKAAVARYQDAYHVRGDPRGYYGPHTLRSLESRTGR